ncbi:MAG: PHP-associated domain-containing protein [Halobacteriales archaeon]
MSDVGTRLKIDPHVHSEGSNDGHEPVEHILEHAADIELDGVVVTDHDTIEESRRAAELAPDYGLVGIPGVEVSTRSGHLLAIGVSERPPEGRSFEETVRIVRDHDGVAVVPHPFQRSRHGIRKRHIGNCDGIEVYNSMLFTGYRNRRAQTFARKRGYPKYGASDAHLIPSVGRAYTEVRLPDVPSDTPPADIEGSAVIEALRAGETQLSGKRTPIHRSARQYAKGAARRMAFYVTSTVPGISS